MYSKVSGQNGKVNHHLYMSKMMLELFLDAKTFVIVFTFAKMIMGFTVIEKYTRAVRKVLRQSPFKRKLLVYQHKTSHVTCFRCILYYFVWKTEIILLGTFLSLL